MEFVNSQTLDFASSFWNKTIWPKQWWGLPSIWLLRCSKDSSTIFELTFGLLELSYMRCSMESVLMSKVQSPNWSVSLTTPSFDSPLTSKYLNISRCWSSECLLSSTEKDLPLNSLSSFLCKTWKIRKNKMSVLAALILRILLNLYVGRCSILLKHWMCWLIMYRT
jgi:hypothetical protein